MEHHIAQSSPISPRQKGMEGSRQALLYGVYDAFAGARSLISRRLCALITAIGIAVFTISSSAWATHGEVDSAASPGTNVPASDVESGTDANSGDQLQPNSVHSEDIGEFEVCGSVNNADCGGVDGAGNDLPKSNIRAGSIGTRDIGDGAVSGSGGAGNNNIEANSITSADLQIVDTAAGTPGAVANDNIQDNAVTTDKIGAGEVCGSIATTDCTTPTAADIGAGSIGTTDLADGGVGNADLAPDAVSGSGGTNPGNNNIVGNSIGENEIGTDAVTNDELASNAVSGSGGAGGTGTNNIEANSITDADIAPDAVTNSELAPNAVSGSGGAGGTGTNNIEANSIDTAEIMDGAVEGQELAAGEVCGSADNANCAGTGNARTHIKTGSIGTDDLADGGVGNTDLAADAVSGGEDGVAPFNNIVDESITTHDLADGAVVGDAGTTDTSDIATGTIGSADLANTNTPEGGGGAVANDNIRNNAVDARTIGAEQVCGSVDAGPNCGPTANKHIGAGTIGTTDLAEVDTSGPEEGQNGAVNTANINTDAVDTRTLANVDGSGQNGAVNTGNINTDAVNRRTIGAGEVCGSENNDDCGINAATGLLEAKTHIKAESISTNDLADNAVTADKINFDAVESRHIADRAVRANHIDDGQIGLRHLNEDVNNVFRRIEGDIDRLDEGIAMSHAISMIKVPEGKEFGISFAGGFYQDKQAAAIGVGFRPSDGLLLSAGASYGFDSQEVGGAVSINFGF